MRNAATAEWILSLVTDPARAAATVGDLLEEDRGAVRFWSSVLQTTASHILDDIWHHPFAILRVVAVVFFEAFLATLAVSAISAAIINVWMTVAPYPVGPNAIYIPRWGYLLLGLTGASGLKFFTGWEVARRSKGREVAAGIAAFAFFAAFIALFLTPSGPSHEAYPPVPRHFRYIPPVCYWAGILLFRLHARRPSQLVPPGVANA